MKKLTAIKDLQLMANSIRQDIIKTLLEAGSGHSAGALGMAEIFTALYFNVLNHNPQDPDWKERDYLVLSNGHICPALYSTMANAGYFSKKELSKLRKLGSKLQGHPHRGSLPGLETTSGPLGCGISQAAGMALGLKMDNKKNLVFSLTSDGEHDEGNTWEALLFAAKYKLDNLIVIIDRNYIQIDGNTEQVLPLESLEQKYRAFNWQVLAIEGHDMYKVLTTLQAARHNYGKPLVIISRNVPGKGVSFMENNYLWHGKAPNAAESKQALKELEHERKRLSS